MARSRSLPANLFENPDFFELDSEAQIILIGLVLNADDYGRGLAHIGLLARKLNKDAQAVEQALAQMEGRELVQRYQDARQCYYVLSMWDEWETLSRPTASKFPAPPPKTGGNLPQNSPEFAQNPQENPEFPREMHSEVEVEVEVEGEEEEEEEIEEEDEGEGGVPPNIVTFPIAVGNVAVAESQHKITNQVARILNIEVTAALVRVVEEYGDDPHLSIVGEADAAREWIDDPGRNRKKRCMTPAFFRNWLKRERTSVQYRQTQQATGTTGRASPAEPPPSSTSSRTAAGPAGRSLMGLEEQYQTARTQGES